MRYSLNCFLFPIIMTSILSRYLEKILRENMAQFPLTLTEVMAKVAQAHFTAHYHCALSVAATLRRRVYVFDKAFNFAASPGSLMNVNSIPAIIVDGRAAVLSFGIQKALAPGDAAAFRACFPEHGVDEDDFGVYVSHMC